MIYYCHTEPEYAENDHPIGTKTVRLTRAEVLERFLAPWARARTPLDDVCQMIVESACIHDWMIIQEGWIEKAKSSENIS